MDAYETDILTSGLSFNFVDGSRHSLSYGFLDEFGKLQEHKIREYLECTQHHSEVDVGTFRRNSGCERPGTIHHHHGRDQYWPMIKLSSVCDDSVLYVGQVKDTSGATERWKGQVEDLKKYSSYLDAVGLDGEPIEFDCKHFPGFRLFFTRSGKIGRQRTSSQKTSRTRSSSCHFSTTLSGYKNLRCLRSVNEVKQASPLPQRPGYQDSKKALVDIHKQVRQYCGVFFYPKSWKAMLVNSARSFMQRYLEWPSINLAEYSAKEQPQPTSFLDTESILVDLVLQDFGLASTRMERLCGVKSGKMRQHSRSQEVVPSTRKPVKPDFEHVVGSCRHQQMTSVLTFSKRLQQLRSHSCWFVVVFFLDFASRQRQLPWMRRWV